MGFMALLVLVLLLISLGHSQAFIKASSAASTRARRISYAPLRATIDVQQAQVTYDREAWEKGWETCMEELCAVVGTVPTDINGTLYRNGPAKFMVGEEKVLHPFDGDGMVTAVTFQDGKAVFRNRFVRTRGFMSESRWKRIMARGAFGTQRARALDNVLDLTQKNVANTNVVYWDGTLLALWEGGQPHRLDPRGLGTLGVGTMRGVLKENQPFSAHPRIDAKKKRLLNFSLSIGVPSSKIRVYEFDSDTNVVNDKVFDVQGTGVVVLCHDWVATDNYYVFDIPTSKFDPLPWILGQKCVGQCVKIDYSKPNQVFIVPRNGGKVIQFGVPAHFPHHFANAYEDPDGNIVFDMIKSDAYFTPADVPKTPVWESVDFDKLPTASLKRVTLSQKSGRWLWNESAETDENVDQPSINPAYSCQPHRYVYTRVGCKGAPLQGIMKLDRTSGEQTRWFPAPHKYCSEAAFAPRTRGANINSQAEDDGYVISYIFDGKEKTSELAIFDAKDITSGPLCVLPLGVNVPHDFHGTFYHGLVFPEEEIFRKFKVADALERNVYWNEVDSSFGGLFQNYMD